MHMDLRGSRVVGVGCDDTALLSSAVFDVLKVAYMGFASAQMHCRALAKREPSCKTEV